MDKTKQTRPPGAEKPVDVRVRRTPQGPRIFVDGKAVRPRFFYGSPPCLSPISNVEKHAFTIPFRPEADTERGRVSLDGFDDDAPLWFSKAALVDKTDNVTVSLSPDGEEERTRHFVRDGLRLKKGHLYHFVVTHRSTHQRTYFTHEASYTDGDGRKVVMPLPYGDTLGDTVRLAAEAQVDFVTFSTDTSWGCANWWAPPGDPPAYGRIDAAIEPASGSTCAARRTASTSSTTSLPTRPTASCSSSPTRATGRRSAARALPKSRECAPECTSLRR